VAAVFDTKYPYRTGALHNMADITDAGNLIYTKHIVFCYRRHVPLNYRLNGSYCLNV